MDPAVYHAVVGPPLQVAAEVAATRGDPTLHADMAAMLALIDLVSRLSDHWRDKHPANTGDGLNDAPAAACVMVLQEAKLPPDTIGQCLAALESAYATLLGDGVTNVAQQSVDRAWQALGNNKREDAIEHLKQGAQQIIAAIEAWQAKRH